MNLETFFNNFDLLADAPNGVQKLKELILQLAVMGKLVPQDENDEPASVLIDNIQFQKQLLLKEGIIKKEKPLPVIEADEIPFELPKGWEWVRLDNLCELITKGSSPKWQGVNYVESGNGTLFITSENVRNYFVSLEKSKYVEDKFNQIEPRSILKNNDILMNIVGASIGRTAIYESNEIANINQAVCLIRIVAQSTLINLTYLLHFFNSPICISFMFDKQVDNARANLSMGNISKFPIPLPPLAEQHRIVAKVDELMALCDRISERQQKRRETRIKINNAAIGQLLTAREPEVFNKSWQHICNNFDLLYSTPDNIGKLRQAILQLAVQGKLVPQDENDEPASVLLEKIKFEKELLVKQGKIKKFEKLSPVKADEVPFALPKCWNWVKLQDIFIVITDGDHQPPPKTESGIPFLVIGNVRQGVINFTDTRFVSEEYFLSIDEIRIPRKGDILYTVVGSYGIPVIIDTEQPFCVQRHIAILKPSKLLELIYLKYLLKSELIFSQSTNCATGIAQKTVPLNGLRNIIVPLPPINEQKKIAFKVNQLMSLCDELETKLTQSVTNSEKLMETAVRQILAANSNKTDKDEFAFLETIPAETTKLETKTAGRRNKKTQDGEALQLNLPGFE